MEPKNYTKLEVIDYIWVYSRYYGYQLSCCERLYGDEEGYTSLIILFNLAENIFKSKVGNYDSSFYDVIENLKDNNYINLVEYHFLSKGKYSIRKIRNLFAHANLSALNIIFDSENKEVLYPLTEDETCLKLYEVLSEVLFNIMLKIISGDLLVRINVNVDSKINNIKIVIKEISSEELLKIKGFDSQDIERLKDMDKTVKYRLAENSGDVNIFSEIFKNLLKKEK